MAAPVVNASLDKASYAPGETATLTVNYSDADSHTTSVTVTVTDASGATGTVTLPLVEADVDSVAVTDDGGRTWTKVSDSGSVAVFQATV